VLCWYNASDEISQLAVQGPLALKAMQKLTDTHRDGYGILYLQELTFAGIKDVIFSLPPATQDPEDVKSILPMKMRILFGRQ